MAVIRERQGKNGKQTFSVVIRKKGKEEGKTFLTREDAELYEFYKERMITNMKNFDVPLCERMRLIDIAEIKLPQLDNERAKSEIHTALKRCIENMKKHVFLNELTLEDWRECLVKIQEMKVPVKFKSKEMVNLSLSSIRRIFATLSSVFSHAINHGIALENYPLKVLQLYINPLIKGDKNEDT